jgi:hypothetical protein
MQISKIYRYGGFTLIGVAIIGYLTVADEFHHMGELIGVTGVLIAGIFLVVAGYQNYISERIALQWISVGIGAGLIKGAAIDNMLFGLILGVFTGFMTALLKRPEAN